MEPRLDLFAEQFERGHHPLMRDFAAAVQLGEDAVDADLPVDLAQPSSENDGLIIARDTFPTIGRSRAYFLRSTMAHQS